IAARNGWLGSARSKSCGSPTSRPFSDRSSSGACQWLPSWRSSAQASKWMRLKMRRSLDIGISSFIGLFQPFVFHAVRCRLFAFAFDEIGVVFGEVAFEEHHFRIAFVGEDMRGDAVEEPAIVRDHHRIAGEGQ